MIAVLHCLQLIKPIGLCRGHHSLAAHGKLSLAIILPQISSMQTLIGLSQARYHVRANQFWTKIFGHDALLIKFSGPLVNRLFVGVC